MVIIYNNALAYALKGSWEVWWKRHKGINKWLRQLGVTSSEVLCLDEESLAHLPHHNNYYVDYTKLYAVEYW